MYVIRSGQGFLVNAETLEMVADPALSDSAVFDAKRYAKIEEAEEDMNRLLAVSLDAVAVLIQRVKYSTQ